MTPEEKAWSTGRGAPEAWRSTLSPDGDRRGSPSHAGSRESPDGQGAGVNPAAARDDSPGPGQIPHFIRAHLASIVAIAVAVTAGAAAFAGLQTREYTSQAVVVVYPSAAEAGTGAEATLMSTEQAVATSEAVVGAAAKRLHVPDTTLHKGLSAGSPAQSYLLHISYTDPNPRVAQRNAQAVADAYVAYRTPPTAGRGHATTTGPTATGGDTAHASAVSPASFPAAPSSPNLAIDIGAGLVLGIVLGLSFALARDRFDDRLRGPDDLEAQSGARVLAVIPAAGGRDPGDALAVLRDPGSKAADAFRGLRTRVVQAAAWQEARTILVARPEGEDEARVAGNLAAALALAGQHVVLVCADPSRTGTQELFSVAEGTGLAGVLAGDTSLASAIQPTGVAGLEILPAGPAPGGRATVMRASDLRGVISGIRGWADFVIIDAPAVLTAPESSVLAELADMVLLAADSRDSTRTGVRAAARELEQVHPVLDGCVFAEAQRRTGFSPRPWSQWDSGRFREAVGRTASKVPPPPWRPSLVRIVRHGAETDDD